MKKAFYPPLVAAFLVLALFNANTHQLVWPSQLIEPLLIAVGLSSVLWLALSIVLRSWQKSALPTCLLTIMCLEYGHVRGVFGLPDVLTIAFWCTVFVATTALVLPKVKEVPTKVFNITAVCLFLVVLVPFSIFALDAPRPRAREASNFEVRELLDIYYIILDEYGRDDILLNVYGYDNSEFMTYLTDRGFYVSNSGCANYPHTVLSLASSLTMNYLPKSHYTSMELFDITRNCTVRRYLEQLGYTIVNVHNVFFGDADVVYDYGRQREFAELFNELSLFYVEGAKYQFRYDCARYKFEQLMKIPRMPEATFTLAHIMVTHAPYIFNADGSFRKEQPIAGKPYYEAYIDSIKATNILLQKTIDAILSEGDAIIILQSDTGTKPPNTLQYLLDHDMKFDTVMQDDPYLVYARLANFNAVYPSVDAFTSSVNTFRVIFNRHLDTSYDILPDRHFWTRTGEPPFDVFEVTNELREYAR